MKTPQNNRVQKRAVFTMIPVMIAASITFATAVAQPPMPMNHGARWFLIADVLMLVYFWVGWLIAPPQPNPDKARRIMQRDFVRAQLEEAEWRASHWRPIGGDMSLGSLQAWILDRGVEQFNRMNELKAKLDKLSYE
jgi:hypothetical protein